uniref:Uncharacterized protein n=1 Tax=Oryza punctata TaxID=4537 RepID=A0A0E0K6I8_ORYPU
MGILGSDKFTATVNQNFEQVGERVIEMLDQVTPFAKEMFSFMENSKNSTPVWPEAEDLPERRSLCLLLFADRSFRLTVRSPAIHQNEIWRERRPSKHYFLEEIVSVLGVKHGTSGLKPRTPFYCTIKCISLAIHQTSQRTLELLARTAAR